MFEVLTGILAVVMLLAIAFPQFVGFASKKIKRVGSPYWGVYEGENLIMGPNEGTVEVPKPARRFNPIAGSSQYASGKGTSFRK